MKVVDWAAYVLGLLSGPSHLDDRLLSRPACIRECSNQGAVEHLLQHALSHLACCQVADVQLQGGRQQQQQHKDMLMRKKTEPEQLQ